MPHWSELFVLDVSALELFIRTSATYLALTFALRVIGRRELGMEMTDMLMIVLISEGVSAGMAGAHHSVTGGLVVAGTLLGWNYLFAWLVYQVPFARKVLRGGPLLIVADGKMIRRHMRKELISEQELLGHLRHAETQLEDVKCMYVEPDGEISVVKR